MDNYPMKSLLIWNPPFLSEPSYLMIFAFFNSDKYLSTVFLGIPVASLRPNDFIPGLLFILSRTASIFIFTFEERLPIAVSNIFSNILTPVLFAPH